MAAIGPKQKHRGHGRSHQALRFAMQSASLRTPSHTPRPQP